MAKTGRNEPCPCGKAGPDGARLKYKRCCGSISSPNDQKRQRLMSTAIAQHEAAERQRVEQQGHGEPFVTFETEQHLVVAIKNRLAPIPKGSTVADFLGRFLMSELGIDWLKAEMAKPQEDRNTVANWYENYVAYQTANKSDTEPVSWGTLTGAAAAWLGFAYNLYLVEHNVGPQTRLLTRLRDRANFQGAYFELMTFGTLLRAGFTLDFIDESATDKKVCELIATSKATGERFWVEAKARGVAGQFGKDAHTGSAKPDPLPGLKRLLRDALEKEASGRRMIFVDLNAEVPAEVTRENKPAYVEAARQVLQTYEADGSLKEGDAAYVFVTSASFHRELEERARLLAVPWGLGIPDFNHGDAVRLAEKYRKDKRHRDAVAVCDALVKYLDIPTTFDGSLPDDEAFPIKVGNSYGIHTDNEGTLSGRVAHVTALEDRKLAIIELETVNGNRSITMPMTDTQLIGYRKHRNTYFGVIAPVSRTVRTAQEYFNWLMEAQSQFPRAKMMERLRSHPHWDAIQTMPDDEVCAEYCEQLTADWWKASGQPADPDTIIKPLE